MAWPVVAAAVGGGLALWGASKSSSAAESAAGTQAAAADRATQAQLDMYYQGRSDLAPWRAAGTHALQNLLGTPIYGSGTGGTATGGAAVPPVQQPVQQPAPGANQATAGTAPQFVRTKYLGGGQWEGYWSSGGGAGAAPTYESQYGPRQPGSTWDMGTEWERQNDVSIANPPLWQTVAAQSQQGQPGQQAQQTQSSPGEITGYSGTGLLGQGPGQFIPEQEPGYKFGYEEFIEKPSLRLASATGKLGSGATLKALSRYASDYASTKYDNFLDRWYKSLDPHFRLAGMGSNVAISGGQQAGQTGAGVAQTTLAGGQAQAAGQMGSAYPYSQLANWGATNLMQYGMGQTGTQNQAFNQAASLYNPPGGYNWTPQGSSAFYNY